MSHIQAGSLDGPGGTTQSPARQGSARGWWRRTTGAMPTLAVFGLIAGVMHLGHHTGWKLSKISDLTGASTKQADDWCAEHLVPESQCVECNETLRLKPKSFGFCRKHGVAECVIDHPELAQVQGAPALPAYDTTLALGVLPRTENNSRNTLHKHVVQFASAAAVTKSGVDVEVVVERPMRDALVTNGELTFDPTQVAHLASRVSGTVAIVFKSLGSLVQQGDILALIDSAQVGQAKSQCLTSFVQLQVRRAHAERIQKAGSAIAGRTLIDAETALKETEIAAVSARQALLNLGFDLPAKLEEHDLDKLAEQLRTLGIPSWAWERLPTGARTSNLLPIVAPHSGMIVASDIVAGEVVDPTRALFTTADPQRLWLMLSVRQEDRQFVHPGLPVVFRAEGESREVAGQISWIGATIDEKTRTLPVRVEVDNSDIRLLDKSFGTARIVLRSEPRAVVVPHAAVQTTPDATFVFVRDKNYFTEGAPKIFHVRQVRLGAQDDNSVELLAGVLPGEVVVSKGSAVLMAQLLRGNLGAGCGCHEH